MGSKFVIVYACLFLCFVENMHEARIELWFFKRYIDDARGFWHGEKKDPMHFLDSYAKGMKEHIKLTSSVSQTNVVFLDLHILKDVDFDTSHKLSTICHQKELNRYQYMPFSSWHSKQLKEACIIEELRRYILRESNPVGLKKTHLLLFQ